MSKYILAIDQSTSGTKGLLVNKNGEVIQKRTVHHRQIYPKAGWVEHDPIEIYENIKKIIRNLIENNKDILDQLALLTITNQRETVVVWDKDTGKPIYNAIVWQCRRTTDICKQLSEKGLGAKINKKTGLKLDPYFSASKVKWILEHVEGARKKADEGKLLLGTMDSWIIWNLTNGRIHATDVTNASRTLLYNIYTNDWDEELLEIFDIPRSMLPDVRFSDADFDMISDPDLPVQLPISGVIGDSQGALFGQHCVEKGMAKATFGTGTSIMVYTDQPIEGKNGLVTSVAWGMNGQVKYAVEGILNTTGDIIKWLKEDLELFDDFKECEELVKSIPDNNGVYLVPAFVGLGAPYWEPSARAAIFGMDRSTKKVHIIRAGLESIAYQVKDIIELVKQESNIKTIELRVDGGASKNEFLMQFLADILGINVIVSNISDLSAMGSVYMGGLSEGIWQNFDELKKLNTTITLFRPIMDDAISNQYYTTWKSLVLQLINKSL